MSSKRTKPNNRLASLPRLGAGGETCEAASTPFGIVTRNVLLMAAMAVPAFLSQGSEDAATTSPKFPSCAVPPCLR